MAEPSGKTRHPLHWHVRKGLLDYAATTLLFLEPGEQREQLAAWLEALTTDPERAGWQWEAVVGAKRADLRYVVSCLDPVGQRIVVARVKARDLVKADGTRVSGREDIAEIMSIPDTTEGL